MKPTKKKSVRMKKIKCNECYDTKKVSVKFPCPKCDRSNAIRELKTIRSSVTSNISYKTKTANAKSS